MSKEKVLAAFKKAGAPVRPGDIEKVTGLDKKIVTAAIKELKADGKIYSPKMCFYQIK